VVATVIFEAEVAVRHVAGVGEDEQYKLRTGSRRYVER
jgi:hypothetical protein